MLTAFPADETVPHLPAAAGTADDALRGAVLRRLSASGYVSLRALRCEVAGAVVILRGALPSYYLKQMAQTLVLRLTGVRGVTNLVEVRRTEPAPGEPAPAHPEP